MELVNKLHPTIAENGAKGQKFVHITEKEMCFSKAAVRHLGLERGKYLHFLIDLRIWHFFQGEDPAGFMLIQKNHNGSLRLHCPALCEMFLKETRYSSLPLKFDVEPIFGEYAGQKLFKIVTKKPLNI